MDILTQVIWHRDKWMSPALDVFVKILQKELQE
jgi:hypothetical protein